VDPQGLGPDDTDHESHTRAAKEQRVPGLENSGSHRHARQQKSGYDLERGKHDELLR
jgi:hypothetical protein